MQSMLHGAYAVISQTGPGISLNFAQHAQLVLFSKFKLERVFSTKMPYNRVIVMAPEYFRTASATSLDVLLHLVVLESDMLLSMALVLAWQHGQNIMIIGQKPTRYAQSSPDLPCVIIFC